MIHWIGVSRIVKSWDPWSPAPIGMTTNDDGLLAGGGGGGAICPRIGGSMEEILDLGPYTSPTVGISANPQRVFYIE